MTALTDARKRQATLISHYRQSTEAAMQKAVGAGVDMSQMLASGRTTNSPFANTGRAARASEHYRLFRNWVYVCVHYIANRVAGQPWCAGQIDNAGENPTNNARWHKGIPSSMRQKAGSGQELKVIDSHDVLDVLSRPNPVQRKYEFLYLSACNLLLTGESYWIGGEVDGEPQVWAVPTSLLVPDHSNGLYSGYHMRIGGQMVPIPVECVTRTYYPNPSDITSVYSPLDAALSAIRIDDYIQKSQQQIFERGIHPNLMVSVGTDGEGKRPRLTGAQRRQIIRGLRELWSETVSIGDPVIVDSLIESVNKLHLTPQEMDWPSSGEIVKKRIMQAYSLNPIVVGEITSANRAQATVAEKSVNNNVINPVVNSFSETATGFIGPWYEKPARLLLWIEEASAVDREQRLKEWDIARKNDDVSQSEFRGEILGLGPLEERDDPAKFLTQPNALTGLTQLLRQVYDGAISVEQAVQIVMQTCRLPEEDARALVGEPPEKPDPPPQVVMQPPVEPDEDEQEDAEENRPELDDMDEEPVKSARGRSRVYLREVQQKRSDDSTDELTSEISKHFVSALRDVSRNVMDAEWVPDTSDAEKQAKQLADQLFDIDYWSKQLIRDSIYPLIRVFARGAFAELSANAHLPRKTVIAHAKTTTAQDFAQRYDIDLPEYEMEQFVASLNMPEWMVDEAFRALADVLDQSYWQEVHHSTRAMVQRTLQKGIEDGWSIRQIAKEIDARSSVYSLTRARTIARTEVGHAMNAGHASGINQIAAETGLDVRKEWLSVLGSTTRVTHADLDGKIADENGDFHMDGGYRVPWPSHYSLPASERCNCQCGVLSSPVMDSSVVSSPANAGQSIDG